MNHQLINTGAGWRCLRCKVAWDQGDDAPETCEAADDYGFVTDLAKPADPISFEKSLLQEMSDSVGLSYDDLSKGFVPDSAPPAQSETRWLADMVKDMHERNPHVVDPSTLTDYEKSFLPFRPPTREAPVEPDMRPDALYTSRPGRTYSRDRNWPLTDPRCSTTAMTKQVAGSHYRGLAIQPTEFCQRNGLDFCIGSILKYLTRWRSKNGIEDLKKARHFVEIREAFPYHIRQPGHIEITMLEYVSRNNIRPDDAESLYRLEAYYNADLLRDARAPKHPARAAARVIAEIDALISRAA